MHERRRMALGSVLLDIGNRHVRAGLAGEKEPRYKGRSSRDAASLTIWGTGRSFESQSRYRKAVIELLEKVLYRELGADAKGQTVIILDKPLTPTWQKETLSATLRQHFQAEEVRFLPSPIAIALATGRDTALVVDFGYDELSVVPVCTGRSLLNMMTCTTRSGRFVEALLQEVIEGSSEKPDKIWSRLRFTPSTETPEAGGVSKLTDLQCQLALEQLFEDDLDERGVAETILDSVLRCPSDLRRPLIRSIIVSGSLAAIPGFSTRLEQGIRDLLARDCPIRQAAEARAAVRNKAWWRASRHDSCHHLEREVKVVTSIEPHLAGLRPDCLAWTGASLAIVTNAIDLDNETTSMRG